MNEFNPLFPLLNFFWKRENRTGFLAGIVGEAPNNGTLVNHDLKTLSEEANSIELPVTRT